MVRLCPCFKAWVGVVALRGVHLSLTHDACGCVAVCSFRLLPHLQNTGGFFVATFRKLGPMNHSSALKRAVQLQRLGEAVLVASARQKREQKAAKAAARRKPQSQGGRAFASFLEVPATIKERIVDTYGLTYVPMIARGFVCTCARGWRALNVALLSAATIFRCETCMLGPRR